MEPKIEEIWQWRNGSDIIIVKILSKDGSLHECLCLFSNHTKYVVNNVVNNIYEFPMLNSVNLPYSSWSLLDQKKTYCSVCNKETK